MLAVSAMVHVGGQEAWLGWNSVVARQRRESWVQFLSLWRLLAGSERREEVAWVVV